MLVLPDRNPLHVDSGRRPVLVSKRVLRLDDAPVDLLTQRANV